MAFENEYVRQRIEKAQALRAEGINPYCNNSKRNTTIEKYLNVNSDIEEKENQRDENRHYCVSGRIKLLRIMGKASFLKMEDESGMLQVYVARDNLPEDLLELNPYATLPTLVDRELVLYDPQVIIEYLDERFPHPPLMSVDPISKARSRQMLRQIETEWYPLIDTIANIEDGDEVKLALRNLKERLIKLIPVFDNSFNPPAKTLFFNSEFKIQDLATNTLPFSTP